MKIEEKNQCKFYISQDILDKIDFPEGDIGINEFCKYVNMRIDKDNMKALNGKSINDKLKKLNILGTEITEKGNSRTVLGEKAAELGVHTRKMTYSNHSYDQIVYDDKGKKFLVENLLDLLGIH